MTKSLSVSPLRDGEPCRHPGCLSHVSHPCEGCGRVAGRMQPPKPLTRHEVIVCSGKLIYETRDRAEAKLRELASKKFRIGLQPYECGVCGKWHLGHPEGVAPFAYHLQHLLEMADSVMTHEAKRAGLIAYGATKQAIIDASNRRFFNLRNTEAPTMSEERLAMRLKNTGLARQAALRTLAGLYDRHLRGRI